MKLLLDTHILAWALSGDHNLPQKACSLINDNNTQLFCSAAAIWEISIKHAKRPDLFGLSAEKTIQYCSEYGVYQLPLFSRHILSLDSLHREETAPIHNDPFDRIMIAQAKTDNLLFVTHDALLKFYNEPCILYV